MRFYLICLAVAILLFLAVFNFNTYLSPSSKVLGTRAQVQENSADEILFWVNFLKENPTYFEGWLELYKLTGDNSFLTKARTINPNYF